MWCHRGEQQLTRLRHQHRSPGGEVVCRASRRGRHDHCVTTYARQVDAVDSYGQIHRPAGRGAPHDDVVEPDQWPGSRVTTCLQFALHHCPFFDESCSIENGCESSRSVIDIQLAQEAKPALVDAHNRDRVWSGRPCSP